MKKLFGISIVLLFISAADVMAAVPQQVNYQGYLTDTGGNALDTTVAMTFKLYTDSTAGTLLWTEIRPSVTVSDGLFNVRLGQVTSLGDNIFNNAQVWLGITVGGNTEMTPRSRIISVGYSYRVGTVDGASGGTITGNITADSLITGGVRFGDGSVQTTALTGLGNYQLLSDTATWDATQTWVRSMGYLRGTNNVVSSTGFVGGGDRNLARGDYAVVVGGGGTMELDSNSAIGAWSFVGGGKGHSASGNFATISGGSRNGATNSMSTVGGGFHNFASADYATVGGGYNNTASLYSATVGGGYNNVASGDSSVVCGGARNTASGHGATASGGTRNTASNLCTTVGGGNMNSATGSSAVIGGGWANAASGDGSTVGGGTFNRARGLFSFVGGGGGGTEADSNSALSDYATVSGGRGNTGSGNDATVGGGHGNTAYGLQSTVSGGENNYASSTYATIGGGVYNTASGYIAAVGGGSYNSAGAHATVAGGRNNHARGNYSFVGGGGGWDAADSNSARGDNSTVCGGIRNIATGWCSFAAGRRAKANNQGCFVWGDATDADVTANNDNRFIARASGGVYFYSNAAMTTGSYLAAGSGTWQSVSDSTKKRNLRLVDTKDVLNRVAQLPIRQWSYKSQDPSIEHIGPIAQDFWKLFQLGDDSLSISTIDPDGIALAAIQELQKQNGELRGEIATLQAQNSSLERQVAEIKMQLQQLANQKSRTTEQASLIDSNH